MKLFITIIFTILFLNSKAQVGQWTWMKGDNTTSSLGNYGTKGVAAATNEPPCRYQCAYWTDLNGNFWVFGGNSEAYFSELNDLWKFDPITNMWTWVNGPQGTTDPNGEFGTKGVPSVNNYPSIRAWGANCWTDANGDLWLFGGFGSDGVFSTFTNLNDLWRYRISTNEWTWMGGTNDMTVYSYSYGTQTVTAPTNYPPGRQECKSSWIDKNNIAWIFGGLSEDLLSGGFGQNPSNDLWKYDASTNQWTWMKGDQIPATTSNYGTLGVETSTNLPPGRASYTKWMDKNGDMFLFAGLNSFSTNMGFNDVWKYNTLTNNWTWISGDNTANSNGTFTTKCKKTPTEFPSSRLENQTAVVLKGACSEIFWTFGGFGYSGSQYDQDLNDLWMYNSVTKNWTWVSGDAPGSATGSYGTKGVSSPTNKPPGRGGIGIWNDLNNNLWIFGGLSINSSSGGIHNNDLWRFVPDTSCFNASLSSTFTLGYPNDSIICAGEQVIFNLPPNSNLIVSPSSGATISPGNTQIVFSPNVTTTYTISASDNGTSCPGSDTIVYKLIVDPKPDAKFTIYPKNASILQPTFNFNNTSSNAVKYEWYYNGNLVSTQTNPSFTYSDTGLYCFTLVAFNSQNCTDTFTDCGTIANIPPPPPPAILEVPNSFSPNGDNMNDVFKVIYKNIQYFEFQIYTRWGQQVFTSANPDVGWNGTVNGKPCDAGVYYYTVTCHDLYDKPISKKGDFTLLR